jgi:hypothetical protein
MKVITVRREFLGVHLRKRAFSRLIDLLGAQFLDPVAELPGLLEPG